MQAVHVTKISRELELQNDQVKAVALLLEDGATVPFIARYRKEMTASLDEVAITMIRDRLAQLAELDKRRAAILKSLQQHGHLTDELSAKVFAAETLSMLEDIYLPFRPKRRTRATIALGKGLEPLARQIFDQKGHDIYTLAGTFIDPEKDVSSIEDALSGARDIMAEWINEDAQARSELRELFLRKGIIKSTLATGAESKGIKFKAYFDWYEPLATAPSHRILAMRRGENEDVLNLSIAPPEENAIQILEKRFGKGEGDDSQQVRSAIHDSYKRLLSRSLESEIRLSTKEKADAKAIKIFAANLRQLLLAPPLGAWRVMGIDPGFRTGCKLICVDEQGKLLHFDTIYPHTSKTKAKQAARIVQDLCQQFRIEAIGVGNGTAGRETEAFIQKNPVQNVAVVMVDESGASVYSASETAREEFPELDVSIRGAVSIARRLMDPLSELVKIDPKAIGVGQYQHDVDQGALKQALDDVVISCVNAVGVDVNCASAQLLTYVSGLGPQLAKNIVSFRNENGPFHTRDALKKVPRLGLKAFEQAAGFLRIIDGTNPLDAGAVHPESYHIVEAMAADLKCTVSDLIKDADLRRQIDISGFVTAKVGIPTLQDILAELERPGRDPRQSFEPSGFAEDIASISDLKAGMQLPGVVTNVTGFGAFVDIGVHQDGLVHISQLADRFVKDPAQVVQVRQKVNVTVLDVDLGRKRISLTMRSKPAKPRNPAKKAADRTKPPRPQKQNKPKQREGFNSPFADFFKTR